MAQDPRKLPKNESSGFGHAIMKKEEHTIEKNDACKMHVRQIYDVA